MGHWFMAMPIFLIGVIGAVPSLLSGSKIAELRGLRDLFPDLRLRRACRTDDDPASSGRRECELP